MTRTLFVGEPNARDQEIYQLVAKAQAASIEVSPTHSPGALRPRAGVPSTPPREP